jgi:hypothetical protein
MLQAPPHPGATDLAARRQIALDRIQLLIATYELRAQRAMRNHYILQGLAIGLAAITPCLIALAKDNPRNELLNWLQLFFPACAAIAAGLSNVFKWREEGVRYTNLAEGVRSQLWRFQTRAGELGVGLSDEQALDKLVTNVDDLNLKSLATWSAAQVAEGSASPPKTGGESGSGEAARART